MFGGSLCWLLLGLGLFCCWLFALLLGVVVFSVVLCVWCGCLFSFVGCLLGGVVCVRCVVVCLFLLLVLRSWRYLG